MSALCCGITGVFPVTALGLVVRRRLDSGVGPLRTDCWSLAAWEVTLFSLGKNNSLRSDIFFLAGK
ncbi:MAG: hypothetical protein CMG83_12065 [Marinobacter sp.]|nr:hypothetical protein [Marinobacter sp.]MBQ92841.1 hypothetical protein [Marinobacter sp.]